MPPVVVVIPVVTLPPAGADAPLSEQRLVRRLADRALEATDLPVWWRGGSGSLIDSLATLADQAPERISAGGRWTLDHRLALPGPDSRGLGLYALEQLAQAVGDAPVSVTDPMVSGPTGEEGLRRALIARLGLQLAPLVQPGAEQIARSCTLRDCSRLWPLDANPRQLADRIRERSPADLAPWSLVSPSIRSGPDGEGTPLSGRPGSDAPSGLLLVGLGKPSDPGDLRRVVGEASDLLTDHELVIAGLDSLTADAAADSKRVDEGQGGNIGQIDPREHAPAETDSRRVEVRQRFGRRSGADRLLGETAQRALGLIGHPDSDLHAHLSAHLAGAVASADPGRADADARAAKDVIEAAVDSFASQVEGRGTVVVDHTGRDRYVLVESNVTASDLPETAVQQLSPAADRLEWTTLSALARDLDERVTGPVGRLELAETDSGLELLIQPGDAGGARPPTGSLGRLIDDLAGDSPNRPVLVRTIAGRAPRTLIRTRIDGWAWTVTESQPQPPLAAVGRTPHEIGLKNDLVEVVLDRRTGELIVDGQTGWARLHHRLDVGSDAPKADLTNPAVVEGVVLESGPLRGRLSITRLDEVRAGDEGRQAGRRHIHTVLTVELRADEAGILITAHSVGAGPDHSTSLSFPTDRQRHASTPSIWLPVDSSTEETTLDHLEVSTRGVGKTEVARGRLAIEIASWSRGVGTSPSSALPPTPEDLDADPLLPRIAVRRHEAGAPPLADLVEPVLSANGREGSRPSSGTLVPPAAQRGTAVIGGRHGTTIWSTGVVDGEWRVTALPVVPTIKEGSTDARSPTARPNPPMAQMPGQLSLDATSKDGPEARP